MLIEILNQLWLKRWVRVATTIVLVLFIAFIVSLIFNRKSYQAFGPFTTPFSQTQNFSHLQDSSVYSYNGVGFYKLNLDNNQITMLQAGSRLPLPSQISWAGDQGALINFSGSLYDTRVQEALAARGEPINKAAQLYTWYLNFKTNDLSFVSKYPVRKGLSVYNEQQNRIYYVPDYQAYLDKFRETELNLDKFSLNYYDVVANADKALVEDLKTVDVIGLFSCSKMSICVITIPPDATTKTDVLSVSADGRTTVALDDFDGRVFASNNPALVVRVPNVSDTGIKDNYREVDAAEGEVFLYNLETKQENSLGFTLGNSALITNFDGQDFYVFDTNQFSTPGQQEHYYRAGVLSKKGKPSTKQVSITADDKNQSRTGVYLDFASFGSNGRTLLAPVSGNLVLFGKLDQASNIKPAYSNEAKKLVAQCQVNSKPEYQYFDATKQFRILFPQTANWQAELNKFSACLSTKALDAMVGYNYQFSLTDPVSGRLVSD